MKKIWNDKEGVVMDTFEDVQNIALYQHGGVYFEIIKENESETLYVGWVDEYGFDKVFEKRAKREDFINIPIEEMVKFITSFKDEKY